MIKKQAIKIFDYLSNKIIESKYFHRLIENTIKSDVGLSRTVSAIIASDVGLVGTVSAIIASDEGYHKLSDLVEDTKIGTSNLETREKWLEKTLERIPAGRKILDAGAGELNYKKFCNHLQYVSQDFGQYDGKGNNLGLQTKSWDNSRLDIVSDIAAIPVEDASFDAVMCIEVLEHLPEPTMAIKEFSRILKKGGTLILTAPFCSLTHFAPYYYLNGFSKYWYEKILGENKFGIDEIVSNGNYFEYIAQESRRISDVASKYNEKQMTREEILVEKLFLRMLQRLSTNDSKSSELLNFGYHVKAIKK